MKKFYIVSVIIIYFFINTALIFACTNSEILKLVNAGYSKDEIDAICNVERNSNDQVAKKTTPVKTKSQSIYVVKSGDTLSKIAREEMGNMKKWMELYRANIHVIKNADKIIPGQRLIIPTNSSDHSLAQIPKHKTTYKLVTGNKYQPFSDETLPKGGMITEIVNAVFQEMNKKVDIEFWSWKYGYDATLEGEFAATFPYLKNEERKKIYYYSTPLYEMLILPFVKKDSPIKFNTLNDLKGLTLCRPEGYYIHDIKSLIDSDSIDLKRPKELEGCFQMLAKGRVDVVPVNEFSGKAEVHRLNLDNEIKTLDKPISAETLHIIFPKNNPGSRMLQYKFDLQVAKFEKSGKLDIIKRKHLDKFFTDMYK